MKNKIEEAPGGKFVLEMTHVFNAARERVFDAFSRYENMAQWFGPHGCRVTEGSLDFVVGGIYRMQIQSEENEINEVGGTFSEIVSPEQLVFTWQWDPGDDIGGDEMEVTINFSELESGRTEIRLRQTLVPNQEIAESHGWGWGETFERLENILTQ